MIKNVFNKEDLDFIYKKNLKKSNSLDEIKKTLKFLGNPQNNLKDVIHITGTNGKTSVTLEATKQILENTNLKVGTFISPYVVNFGERIQFNKKNISPDEFHYYVEKLKKVPNISLLNFFDKIFVISLLFFNDKKVDVGIIEVGIGGKFDSTNVLNSNKLAVITNVDLDHQKILGNTKEEILEQKLGIINKNTTDLITGPSFSKQQHLLSSKYIKDNGLKTNTLFISNFEKEQNFKVENLMIATRVVDLFLSNINVKRIKTPYLTTIPGRFEKINSKPEIFVDGAHNLNGIKKLFYFIDNLNENKKINVIFSSLEEKNTLNFFKNYKNNNVNFIFTTFEVEHKKILKRGDMDFFSGQINDWKEFLSTILKSDDKEQIFIFTGSLYFISQVRDRVISEKNKYE